nr:DNA-directed DNA polymerase [Tanacetum cinerariifolium]
MLSGFFRTKPQLWVLFRVIPFLDESNPTRSVVAYEGPLIPTPKKVVERETEEITDKEQTNFQGTTTHIQPPVTPILEPDVPKTLPKPNIPYPLRLNDQKLREKATNQMEKFFQIFQDLHFEISFADALLLMPKFASTIKSLLTNKDKEILLEYRPCFIDVYGEEITLRVNDEAVTFNLNQTTRYSSTYDDLSENRIDIIDVAREEYDQEILGFSNNSSGGNPTLTFEPILFDSSPFLTPFEGSDFILEEIEAYLKNESISPEIDHADCDSERDICLIEKLLMMTRFKSLRWTLRVDKLPVIIAKDLKVDEKESLLKVLKSYKRAIAWKITDIKGIDPRFCIHKILMEEDYEPAVQSQRRVNPKIHEVIKKDVIKLLDAGMIYLISDSLWVSLIHCVLKKGGITVVENENNELIPTRMAFGLCNAPGTFQRCMMAIFHDMIEKTMEVFMDDFSVFGDSISSCLSHLDTMLQRSFLGHAGFHRRFIQDFSKIARPMTHLLEKETPFVFSKDCIDAFETLKKKLTEAPILVVPD